MKTFLNKAKSSFSKHGQSQSPSYQGTQQQKIVQQHDTASSIYPASPLDVIRYRYHHATNLGSIFVLEQWLTGSMFVAGASGGSELDAVNA